MDLMLGVIPLLLIGAQAMQHCTVSSVASEHTRRHGSPAEGLAPPGVAGSADEATVKLRGLPYAAVIDDIVEWLTGAASANRRKKSHEADTLNNDSALLASNVPQTITI